jgi:hypothetical protein
VLLGGRCYADQACSLCTLKLLPSFLPYFFFTVYDSTRILTSRFVLQIMSLLRTDAYESPLVLVGNMFEQSVEFPDPNASVPPEVRPPPELCRSIGGFSFAGSTILPDPSDRALFARACFCPPNTYASAVVVQTLPTSNTDLHESTFRPSLALLQDTEPQRRARFIAQSVAGLLPELCQIIACSGRTLCRRQSVRARARMRCRSCVPLGC